VINIEQHEFVSEGDEEDLFELTHLTVEDLEDIEEHLYASPVSLSPTLSVFVKQLTNFLQSLDMPRAG
jgi:hypothetical protein